MRATATVEGRGLLRRTQRAIGRFRRDEGGAMIALGIILMVLMLLIGGMAIDLMRTENTRVRLQNTLDRAILAATDLDQTLSPEAVVEDYFDKAGLLEYLETVNVRQGFNFREVSATVRADVPTMFLKMLDMPTLPAPAAGTAEEVISDIEITLVLDVSNSMNSNSRLANLKIAARAFVDTVLSSPQAQDKISISLVMYTGQVHVGAPLINYYNVTGTHTFGMCVNFPEASFSVRAFNPSDPLPRADFFDPWYTSQSPTMRYCPSHPSQAIMPFQSNPTVLKNRITALIADGNTSIDIGMKWGVHLLDPSFRPVLTQLINTGQVPAAFAGRPFSYGQENTAKFIVLMSDGENTDEYIIRSPYNTGLSNVYWNSSQSRVSVYHSSRSGSNKYWWPRNSTWNAGPDGPSVQMTWPEVWNRFSVRWVATNLFATPLSQSATTWRNTFLGATGPATKDARTASICAAAKQANITIFAIAFEAPPVGQTTLLNCASSPSHYFSVNGLDIATAFRAIARQINQLRLTQ